jgi:hypothetical protein
VTTVLIIRTFSLFRTVTSVAAEVSLVAIVVVEVLVVEVVVVFVEVFLEVY